MTAASPELRFFFPRDGSEEWLSIVDAWLAVEVLGMLGRGENETLNVLEIGVWKGAWSSVVLMNDERTRAVGVDPYPSNPEAGGILFQRLTDLGVSNRFVLLSSTQELNGEKFALIHVDGDHSERMAESDLRTAHGALETEGVLIVDDIANANFPGVASAFYRLLASTDLRLFMMSGSKGYVAAAPTAARLYSALLARLSHDSRLRVQRFWGDQESEEYTLVQPTSVLGQEVLLVSKPPLVGTRSVSGPFKRFVRGVTPPYLLTAMRQFRRRSP